MSTDKGKVALKALVDANTKNIISYKDAIRICEPDCTLAEYFQITGDEQGPPNGAILVRARPGSHDDSMKRFVDSKLTIPGRRQLLPLIRYTSTAQSDWKTTPIGYVCVQVPQK